MILSCFAAITACSSSEKKESADAASAPASANNTSTSDIFAEKKNDAVVEPGEIVTSEKKLTPINVPGSENSTAGMTGLSGPNVSSGLTVTLKPDPKAGSPVKIASRGEEPAPKAAVIGVDPAVSQRWLKNGNTRFAKGWFRKDGQATKDIKRLVAAHRPHAVVLASSDARVPPELVFDQKLGEIFTIRTLGPSLSPEVLGSIEYALMNLGTRNIVILGHSSCGGAKIAYITMDAAIAGSDNLKAVVSDIQPRIRSLVEGKQPSKNFVQECWANTKGIAEDIKLRSSVVKEAIEEGQVQINSALYDLETGKVEFR